MAFPESPASAAIFRRDVIGAVPPPPGVVPQFESPESHARSVIISTLICISLATLSLCMRLYTRTVVTRRFEPTDYAFVASWVCSCVLSAITVATCLEGGLGNHIWDISLAKFTVFLKLKICTSAFYCIGIMFIKLSLLLFYLQLSVETKFRLVVHSLIVVVTSYSIASVFVVIFSCFPVSKSWDITISDGYCVNLPVFYIANLSLNSLTDVVVLILPVPMLWNLRMPLREKIAVGAIFMTGSAVCVVSILRIRALVVLLDKYDITWELVEGYIWSAIELNTAIVCAALLFIKPLLRQVFPRLLGSTMAPGSGSKARRNAPDFSFQTAEDSIELGGCRVKGVTAVTVTASMNSRALKSESQEEIIECGGNE